MLYTVKDKIAPFYLLDMIEIEYENQKIAVPTNWDDIPLSKYETFYHSKPTDHRERVDLIAMICEIDSADLRQWPASVFNIIVKHVKFIFDNAMGEPDPVISIGGVNYVVAIEDELSLGAWVDAEAVQKEGVAVLSNVLAIVCRPTGEPYDDKLNEERARMFAALPASKVLGVLAFFLQCRRVLEAHTKTYTALKQLADQLPRSIKPLLSRGAGIRLSQIWPTIKYYALTQLLRYQLGRLLRSCNIASIKRPQIKHSAN